MYDIQPFAFAQSPAFAPLFRFLESWPLDDGADWQNIYAPRVRSSYELPSYELRQLDEQAYALTLAIPGFRDKDVSVEVQGDQLSVRGEQRQADKASGKESAKPAKEDAQGIQVRRFQRQFQLGEHVRIADAKLADGLLTIKLNRELPAEQKPRQIKISRG